MSFTLQTGVREECGVFGIYNCEKENVARDICYGLTALQHRGQEACGIAVVDTDGPLGQAGCRKGLGLVNEVFHEENTDQLQGNLGIGHVRYSTTGSPTAENIQPLVLKYHKGVLCLAHNGNLINTQSLRRKLQETGAVFQTTMDSEVISLLIARERLQTSSVEEAIRRTAAQIRGAYALVILSPRKLIGVRDPLGLRPLCLGKKGKSWILASESCAINAVGGEFIRDIEPGEIITITGSDMHSRNIFQKKTQDGTAVKPPACAHCIFEYIYFARLDSYIDGISVYEARLKGGAALARTFPVPADVVTGVPDSGLVAAMGYAREAGIPFSLLFHKNSYVGRTFIKPTQKERENSVRMKLSVIEPAVKGKRIILVDDSIVRGTTIRNLIGMLKKAGAREVHVRISSPPFLYPCYFGTDVPSNRQLIASSRSSAEIQQEIGADSLAYMPVFALSEMVGRLSICTACFTGSYPMDISSEITQDR